VWREIRCAGGAMAIAIHRHRPAHRAQGFPSSAWGQISRGCRLMARLEDKTRAIKTACREGFRWGEGIKRAMRLIAPA
jgi:hypothetical protein